VEQPEQSIKEGNQAVKITRLSCHGFRHEVRLRLSVIADNTANLWRRLVPPSSRAAGMKR